MAGGRGREGGRGGGEVVAHAAAVAEAFSDSEDFAVGKEGGRRGDEEEGEEGGTQEEGEEEERGGEEVEGEGGGGEGEGGAGFL